MKICWDNIDKLKLTVHGNFKNIETNITYVYMESCQVCKEPYLTISYKKGKFCDHKCCLNYQKNNNPMYGKHHSNESKRKIGDSTILRKNGMLGKTHSKITKEKIKKSREKYKGELHPNWKGGISADPYCFEFNSKEFKDFIKERDGNICLNPECNRKSNNLCVHHIDYNKKNCELDNLITVCNSCNVKANKDREWHESWYKAIVYKREFING